MTLLKLLLCRHGESTGNRDHIWAGITDNELTSHGFLQAQRLGSHLAKSLSKDEVISIYSSDLTRARRTAGEVGLALGKAVTATPLLREQDLGWREGLSIKLGDRSDPRNATAISNNPGESKFDMDKRAVGFIEQYLMTSSKIIQDKSSKESEDEKKKDEVIIVVSHGLFLLRLYYILVSRLLISLPPTPSWSNTGCTQITVRIGLPTLVTDINSIQHLTGLKRTRAGVGSSQYDPKQKKVSEFFAGKRQKRDHADTVADSNTKYAVIKSDMIQSIDHDDKSEKDMVIPAEMAAIDAACAAHDQGRAT